MRMRMILLLTIMMMMTLMMMKLMMMMVINLGSLVRRKQTESRYGSQR